MRRFALLALPLMLAACSQEAAEEAEAPVDEVAAPAENATLDLQATGIIIPAQNGIEELAAPFGSARAATEATMGNVLGAVLEQGVDADCGAGPMQYTTYDGITLNFQDDTFVGYSASAPYVPRLTRAEMLADPEVALVEDSTLGDEFTIGSGEAIISGVFNTANDQDLVSSLWAGAVCVYR